MLLAGARIIYFLTSCLQERNTESTKCFCSFSSDFENGEDFKEGLGTETTL